MPFEFVGYPVTDQLRAQRLLASTGNQQVLLQYTSPSAFGNSPDLHGKYAAGIDYTGQPVYEQVWDSVNPRTMGPMALVSQMIVPAVEDSAYEIDLSSDSRRGLPSTVSRDDDAPFSVAEMERILRAHDPESGTAPSRLWELVDAFDPEKYMLTVASDVNNITPEEIALAQSNTAANRRQATTISSDVPTPSDVVPSYITELGADGAPGIAGVDDDDNGTVDDLTEIGFPLANGVALGTYGTQWPDDFASLVGRSVAEARLVDVLWYRIQRSRIERGANPFDLTNPAEVAILDSIAQQLLPPEVLAGYRMDLNRPFGDGRDNNGNGLVDEPLEAGEPYADVTAPFGVWNQGDPFIDLDGNGRYNADVDRDGELDPVLDRIATRDANGDGVIDNLDRELVVDNLWEPLLGSPALVANSMTKDVSGRVFVDRNSNQAADAGEIVYDDNCLARQLYARHLYVMTMLLMDENYIAPFDPNDAQTKLYLERKEKEFTDAGMDAFRAKVEARRKYTCRQVAQWAVNCCDFRDSDSTMTPFEYDENPWDGWNCVNSSNGAT